MFTHKDRSEVDIRAAQEIKNHQDLMYETHQKMNSLNESINSLSMAHEKSKAKAANDHQKLLIDFENLKQTVDKQFKDLVDRFGKVESLLFQSLSVFKNIKEEVSSGCVKKTEFEKSIEDLENTVISDRLKQSLKNDNFNHNFSLVTGQLEEEFKKLRKEIDSQPSEIDPIMALVDERFKVWKVDCDGLYKDISVLKKSVQYDQKKFEHIYTLIERLKEGGLFHKKA